MLGEESKNVREGNKKKKGNSTKHAAKFPVNRKKEDEKTKRSKQVRVWNKQGNPTGGRKYREPNLKPPNLRKDQTENNRRYGQDRKRAERTMWGGEGQYGGGGGCHGAQWQSRVWGPFLRVRREVTDDKSVGKKKIKTQGR